MNSFRSVERALDYEIQRQIDLLKSGGQIVQETRLWDANREVTRSMRSKESAHDYRYFPDPDLLPLLVSDAWLEDVRRTLPELPDARRERFVQQYGLPDYDAEVLTARKDLADYFEAAVTAHDNPKATSNWVMGDFLRVVRERKLDEALVIHDWPVTPANLAGMIRMIDEAKISGKIAKTVFEEMVTSGASPEQIVAERGLSQVTDEGAIRAAVAAVVESNPEKVAEYRAGKEKLFGFFVGQVMKATQGKANPQIVNSLLQELLAG
jgi:aspartyl-tRNA(Asn)/glutamyl-tRNA(Gln) amidotransferase subunit B